MSENRIFFGLNRFWFCKTGLNRINRLYKFKKKKNPNRLTQYPHLSFSLPPIVTSLLSDFCSQPPFCSGACCSTSDFSQVRIFTFSRFVNDSTPVSSCFSNSLLLFLIFLSSFFVRSIFASACSIFASSTHTICFNKTTRVEDKASKVGSSTHTICFCFVCIWVWGFVCISFFTLWSIVYLSSKMLMTSYIIVDVSNY